MSTRIRQSLTYDAPLGAVAGMLADQGFREQVCEATGMLRYSVTVAGAGAGMRVEIEQVRSTAGVPSFARSFLGDEITIVQVEQWTALDAADVTVSIPGRPGEVTGAITLREVGGTTTEDVELDIQVGLPLVGGKLERLVGDLFVSALDVENAVGRGYLSR